MTVLSVMVGARGIAPGTVWDALFHFDSSSDEQVMVRELRLPRTVIGLLVGAALGLCGALIQAFTRNPLADPGILGVNAGAGFAVTFAVGVLGLTDPTEFIWFALAGAFALTVLVYVLGSLGADRATPVKLTLAGVALTAVFSGLTSALTLKSLKTLDVTRFWDVGSIGGRSLDVLPVALPLIGAGLLLGLFSAHSLNALALGDDSARSLGVRLGATRACVVLAVTLLAGTAVAVAGPIAFIGLMVPHVVRWFTGPDQRWILPLTVLVAPAFLLAADVVGRVVLPSGELRVGLVTALVGAPVLVALVRRRNASGL
ncbi:Fe(3+)-siderophore ABC transporter permease (plasmid) [Streptomyces clavuligerus]|uniref:Ferric enterobactin transport system permease protein FepD n=2 Tax=Streptomyces clavuligerus TaxID=1901 RepID=D5SMD2_STRCL|nr:Ferric enterobactin transport system permease protein FepD [Streptomyces clavuligerus]QCS10994.1 Fe(3+)-siderophore ABC transporter permease [Streptomyces clavuligerus]QPJ98410.1 iron chelate uptake ABC transporter family permease subunit [Streptomyces clavuligerus]